MRITGFSSARAKFSPCIYSARVLFVVQPNERNIFDQRILEYQLFEACATYSVVHFPKLIWCSSQPRHPRYPPNIRRTRHDCINSQNPGLFSSRPSLYKAHRNLGGILSRRICPRRLRIACRLCNTCRSRTFARSPVLEYRQPEHPRRGRWLATLARRH